MNGIRTLVLAAAATAVATVAYAQVTPTPAPPPAPPSGDQRPPAPPPPPPPPQPGGPRGPGGDMRGPGGMHHFGPGGPDRMQPPSKGAYIRYDRQGGLTIKCPDDEPIKACLDAAQPLVDKLLQQR